MRHRDDPDAGLPLVPEFDETRVLDSHDGGTLYTISRGDGADDRVLPRRHALVAGLGQAVRRRSPPPGSAPSPSTRVGTASRSAGETGHSLDNLADDVRTVLEGLDLHDVVLVGHSMGGMAVQAFAIRHPDVLHDRVRGLVLQSTVVAQPGERRQAHPGDARTHRPRGSRLRHLHAPAQPRLPPGADRVRRRPVSEPRRSDARDARRVRPRDDTRRRAARCSASISPRACPASTCPPSCWWAPPTRSRRRATRAGSPSSCPTPASWSTRAPGTC